MKKQELVGQIYPELKKIENEIREIKILIVGGSRKIPRKAAKLEGVLKGVRIEESDLEEAKKSLFGFDNA